MLTITGNHPVLEKYRDIVPVWSYLGINGEQLWKFVDCMGEVHGVIAITREEARRLIDAAIDRKQVRILRAELDAMEEGKR